MSDTTLQAPRRQKWMTAGLIASRPDSVDREHGVIRGAKIVTAGEAKGHGVSLDSDFVAAVARLGAAEKGGLKARFGHPNMCSTALGTFLGRWKGFSLSADGTIVTADLFLSKTAQKTPNGDLYGYTLDLAGKDGDPGAFGVSIVFTPGAFYKKDAAGVRANSPWDDCDPGKTAPDEMRKRCEAYDAMPGPEYVECAELHAADCVDDPAANSGMFSAWSKDTLAAQATEFLDTHPEVFTLLRDHPQVLTDFQARYATYLQKKDTPMDTPATDTKSTAEATPAAVAPEVAAPATDAAKPEEQHEAPPAGQTPAAAPEPPATVAASAPPPAAAQEPAKPAAYSIDTFREIEQEFGRDIAVEVMLAHGNRVHALAIAHQRTTAALKAKDERIAALQKQLESATGTQAGGKPAATGGDPAAGKISGSIFSNVPKA